jgi:plasmid stability protein
MADLNLKNLDERLVSELDNRAHRKNASLAEEAVAILEDSLIRDQGQSRAIALDLIANDVQRLNAALERNWLVQLIVATVGVALAFDVGGAREAAYTVVRVKFGPLAVALSAVYFYYFMRFGYLLIRFVPTRRSYDRILDLTLGGSICPDDLLTLRNTSSYFEMFYSRKKESRAKAIGYFFFTIAIASAAQASALWLPLMAYPGETWVIGVMVFYVMALTFLYTFFWRALESHRDAGLVVKACIVAVLFWIMAFELPEMLFAV